MRATNLIFRLIGVLSLALVAVGVRADSINKEPTPAPAIADAEASVPRPKDPAALCASGSDSRILFEHPAATTELVTERYPNGSVKVERHVTKDANENYVNHGTYTVYGTDGKVQMTGEYLWGKQTGHWTQTLAKDDGHLFADRENEFVGPFTSEATFTDGQLNGTWTIKDSKGQNIVEWKFEQGVPDGTWTWWSANGSKRLEATYKAGTLDGDVSEYDQDGKTASKETYLGGMHLTRTVGWYTLGRKHFEGSYLRAADLPEPTYDWWKSTVTTVAAKPATKELKHGLWVEWYPSGNKKTEAQYDHDVAIGKFAWWYENGQKQAEVSYHQGRFNGDG